MPEDKALFAFTNYCDESIVPQFVLRPLQLRTKAATLKLPQMA